MVGYLLYFLPIFLILDITRRIGELIEESREDDDAEINISIPISRRTYDKID